MKMRFACRLLTGVAALGMLCPASVGWSADPVRGAPAAAPEALVHDIALAAGGTLSGQIVNSAGQGVPGIPVVVRRQDTLITSTTSGQDGHFVIEGLPGGVFQISADKGGGAYRLWAPQTAPPAAGSSALIVHDTATVRGQTALSKFFSSPLLIAGIVVAAVAIPVAINNIREDRSGS